MRGRSDAASVDGAVPIDYQPHLIDVLTIIVRHLDKPCPAIDVFADQLQMSDAEAERVLAGIAGAGLIEVETTGGRRRMRMRLGQWTGWMTDSDCRPLETR